MYICYIKYVHQVLSKLCDFLVYWIKYFGLILCTTGLKMDCSKIDIIQRRKISRYVKDVQSCPGFQTFIEDLFQVIQRLLHLLLLSQRLLKYLLCFFETLKDQNRKYFNLLRRLKQQLFCLLISIDTLRLSLNLIPEIM